MSRVSFRLQRYVRSGGEQTVVCFEPGRAQSQKATRSAPRALRICLRAAGYKKKVEPMTVPMHGKACLSRLGPRHQVELSFASKFYRVQKLPENPCVVYTNCCFSYTEAKKTTGFRTR